MNKIKKSIILLELFILLSICIFFIIVYFSNKKEVIKYKKEIKEYGYYLKDKDNELFEENFNELVIELEKEDIDYESYAKIISKLFVIDFYTLNNKLDKNDIGGVQFIEDSLIENFKLNASNTMYKYILPNYENNRKQELPIVKKVEVIDIKKDENYTIELSWEYSKNLDYEDKGIFLIEKKDNKLYVVEKK